MSDRVLWKTSVAFYDVIWVFNSSGAGVTGLVNADFTSKVTIKDGARVASPTFTLTEIDSVNAPGAYSLAFTPDADAFWQVRCKHATYNVRGWSAELQSSARAISDLAYPATSGRSLAVDASGRVDLGAWVGSAPNALQSGRVDSYLGAVAAGVIAAASFASGALAAVWDALTSALTTSGSIGKLIVDNLNATISSRLASASYTAPLDATATENAVWNTALASHTTAGTAGKKLSDLSTTAPPSAATIAAAVADESLSGHTTAGTLGEAIKTLRTGVLSTGTAQGGTTTTIQLAAGETAQAEAYYGAILTIVSGTGAPQTRSLGYYNSTSKTATVTYPFATAPDNTSVYRIEAGPTEVLGVAIVGPSAISATSLDAGAINSSKIADGTITAAKIASNAITSAKLATDAIGAAQLAADAVAEIQSGLATSSSITSLAATLATIAAYVDELESRLTSGRAANLDNLDVAVSTRLATSGYTAPPTAAQNALELLDTQQVKALTLRDTLARIAASSHGKVSGMATGTPVFRHQDDSGDAISATVDADGNRTAVTLP